MACNKNESGTVTIPVGDYNLLRDTNAAFRKVAARSVFAFAFINGFNEVHVLKESDVVRNLKEEIDALTKELAIYRQKEIKEMYSGVKKKWWRL